jgi:hypothetical protein
MSSRAVFVFLACLSAAPVLAQMKVERFDQPPTTNEINSFKSYILTVQPGTNGNLDPQNDWVQHSSGQRTKAMGLMYEMTHDLDILDRMITYCDAVLSQRNDLAPAPVGQHVLWTGRIDPSWPNSAVEPIGTGGEQGDPVGHLAYCARLILETPAIWSLNVRVGDPRGYGATYLARARRFVREGEVAMDRHILSDLLDLSRGYRMYWGAGNPYQQGAVPWNQVVMFTYALQNLAAAHIVLNDDPSRANWYDAIVKANMDWFFSGEAGCAKPYVDSKGTTAYLWAYRVPSGTEDWSHSNLDIQGIYRAYVSGKYGITDAQMVPLANTFLDVIRRGPNDYAGRVNATDGTGNSAPTTNVRPGWYLAAFFRPSAYCDIMAEDLTIGGTTTDITRFSFFLWVKYKRFASTPPACIPLPTPVSTPTPTPPPGKLGTNLALNKPSSASTNWSSSFNSPKAFDGSDSSRWSASAGSAQNQWLGVDLQSPKAYNCVVMKEISFIRVTSHVLQSSDDGINYYDIQGTEGGPIGALKTTCFDTVTSRYVRLFINESRASGALKEPTINEVGVYFQDRPPVLDVPDDVVREATGPTGAVVTFSATADDEKDGPLPVTLTPPSGSTFPLGTTIVTATATDSAGNKSTATFEVTVQDTTPPTLSLPANIAAEATSAAGATVSFAATASDLVSGSAAVTLAPPSGSTFPLGTTTVNASATDAAGNTAHGQFTVTVRDTIAPVIAKLVASPNVIWPPNHRMVTVNVAALVTEAVDPAPVTHIVSVTSNEPPDGTGDGGTASDWAILGDVTLSVRAERAGEGTGRVYTVTVESRDASGNVGTKTVTISVPHNH